MASNTRVLSVPRVLICGSGAASQTLACVLSGRPGADVTVYSQTSARVSEWNRALESGDMSVAVKSPSGQQSVVKAGAFRVVSDPAIAALDREIVIISIPASLHAQYLEMLFPYLESGCLIVGLPGQCGFEFDVRRIWGSRYQDIAVINFDSLPWTCRVDKFGKRVVIMGTKLVITGAHRKAAGANLIPDPATALQKLLGPVPRVSVSGHLLGITLRSPNALSHPAIMFGYWHSWDGVPFGSAPSFYTSIDQSTAYLIEEIGQEVIRVASEIVAIRPLIDLTQVIPVYQWDIACYGHSIVDSASLFTALRTNSSYQGIQHPMLQCADGGLVPDFRHRFLTEDVPYGLAVIRGIAEVVNFPTPRIDLVMRWCQNKLGREYLTSNGMTGSDIAFTRAPQRYGLTTIDEILDSP